MADTEPQMWICQGCGTRVEAEFSYEHKAECEAYRQSLIDPCFFDVLDDIDDLRDADRAKSFDF